MSLPFIPSSFNGHFHVHDPPNNFDLNQFMNDEIEGGFLSTQAHELPASNTNFINTITGLSQNEVLYQRPGGGGGGAVFQLDVSHRVIETIRTYVTPRRVRVHVVIDYFPMQNRNQYSSLPAHTNDGVNADFMRTHLLTATSTRDRILQVRNSYGRANWVNINRVHAQPSYFQNYTSRTLPSMSMSMSDPPFSETQAFHAYDDHDDLYHYNPIDHQPNYSNHYHTHHHNITTHNKHPIPSRKRATIIKDEESTTEATRSDGQLVRPVACVPKLIINHTQNQQPQPVRVVPPPPPPPKNEVQDLNESCTAIPIHHQRQHQHDQDGSSSSAGTVDEDDDHQDGKTEGDGRTHSLPCKKYGPYTCPRCMRVFNTSQLFAAHMGSHYRSETKAEKRRRQATKYRNRNLRLVHSSDGLTILPQRFTVPATRKCRVDRTSTTTTTTTDPPRTASKVVRVKSEMDNEIGPSPSFAIKDKD